MKFFLYLKCRHVFSIAVWVRSKDAMCKNHKKDNEINVDIFFWKLLKLISISWDIFSPNAMKTRKSRSINNLNCISESDTENVFNQLRIAFSLLLPVLLCFSFLLHNEKIKLNETKTNENFYQIKEYFEGENV